MKVIAPKLDDNLMTNYKYTETEFSLNSRQFIDHNLSMTKGNIESQDRSYIT